MKATTILNGLKIVNAQGAYMTITMDGKNFEWTNTEMTQKDKQYVNNIVKFIRDYSMNDMAKNLSWAKKVEKFVKVINAQKSNNFRNLSSALRKSFDNGTAEFFENYFYEGTRKSFEVA